MAYRIVAATITVTVTVTAKAAAVAIFVAPLFVIVTLVACMRCTEHSSEHDLECLRIAIHTHTHTDAQTHKRTYIYIVMHKHLLCQRHTCAIYKRMYVCVYII